MEIDLSPDARRRLMELSHAWGCSFTDTLERLILEADQKYPEILTDETKTTVFEHQNSGIEQRRFERFAYDIGADYEVAGERYFGHIDDISKQGVLLKFESVSEIETGKMVAVWIPTTDGTKALKMLGRVAWVRDDTAGVEFI